MTATTITPEGAGEFPPLPVPTCTYADHSYPAFTADQMHAFAEATIALRAQGGQAGESGEAPTVPDMNRVLDGLYAQTTPGVWGKGQTTHHTVTRRNGHPPYRIAEFHHANDAAFCDAAHAFMPALLAALRAQAAPTAAPAPDLIARGMRWEECEQHMREACAQAGVQWNEEKEPQSIAINVMQRLANSAHKTGFRLALERLAAPGAALQSAKPKDTP